MNCMCSNPQCRFHGCLMQRQAGHYQGGTTYPGLPNMPMGGSLPSMPAQPGWECPKCEAVHAPFVQSCPNCKPKSTEESA